MTGVFLPRYSAMGTLGRKINMDDVLGRGAAELRKKYEWDKEKYDDMIDKLKQAGKYVEDPNRKLRFVDEKGNEIKKPKEPKDSALALVNLDPNISKQQIKWEYISNMKLLLKSEWFKNP